MDSVDTGWVEPGDRWMMVTILAAITQGWSPSSTYQQLQTLWLADMEIVASLARLRNHKSNIEEPSGYLMSLTRKTPHKCDQHNKSGKLCVKLTSKKRKTSFNGIDYFMTFSRRVI